MSKVAVIGTGRWGRNHARVMNQLGSLWGIADSDAEKRQAQQALFPEAKVVESLDAIIAAKEAEAVVIATPAISHAALTRQALEAGLHVFVEKPFTLNVKEARELTALAEEKKRVLMVGHLMLFHAGITHMKQLIDSGELGKIFYIYGRRVNLGQVRQDENAMWSLGPHDISIILYLLGQTPVRVSAIGNSYIQTKTGVEDVVFLNLGFADGKMANIHLSWLDPHKSRAMTIVGSKKMVVFEDTEATEKMRIYDKGVEGNSGPGDYESYGDLITLRTGDIVIPKIPMSEPLKAEISHFLECIEEGKRPIADAVGGTDVVRILEAADRSLEMGGAPVFLEENTSFKRD